MHFTLSVRPEDAAAAHRSLPAPRRRRDNRPLKLRVADAMREIAAVRGSCHMDDLELRFPGEEVTDEVVRQARRLAGRKAVRAA